MVTCDISKGLEVGLEAGPGEKWDRWERMRVYKNVLFLSVAYMFIFIAFNGTVNLQSSLNPQTGILSLVFSDIFFIVSTIFVAVPLISVIAEKYAMLLSIVGYALYTIAQFYPSLWTLIVTGSLIGIAAGPLWCSKGVYVTIIAEAYAKNVGITPEVIIVKFGGIFFAFLQSAQITGSFISSSVFSINDPNEIFDRDSIAQHCGVHFAPDFNFTDNNYLEKPDPVLIDTVFGIYLGSICVAALIVSLGVDSLRRYDPDRNSKSQASTKELLLDTIKLSIDSTQRLLLPFVIYVGLAVGYLSASFTKSFVACSIGIENVGYVMMTYGICICISSLFFSHLPPFISRLFLISFATTLTIGIIIAKLLWVPTPDGLLTLHVFAGLWGVGEGILTVQIMSFEQLLFPGREDIVYANYLIWETIGVTVNHLLNLLIETRYILGLVLVFLVVGFLLYLIVEYWYQQKMAQVDESNVVSLSISHKDERY